MAESALKGGKAVAVSGDVSDSKAVKDLFDQAEKAFGGVDVLVNCAGTMSVAPLAAMDDASITRLLDINLKGSIYCMREAARPMRDGGNIINFSSSVTRIRQPAFAVYGSTKGAIETITAILAKELGDKKDPCQRSRARPRRNRPAQRQSQRSCENRSKVSSSGYQAAALAVVCPHTWGPILLRKPEWWGIETSIIVPGAITKGTNHFAHAGAPIDTKLVTAYDDGPYSDLRE